MLARPQSLSPLADSRVNDSSAADYPTLQRGAASASRRYTTFDLGLRLWAIYSLLHDSPSRRGSEVDCLAARGLRADEVGCLPLQQLDCVALFLNHQLLMTSSVV